MSTTTVSARIPTELKVALDAEEVDISETIREALETEVRERRRASLRSRADVVASDVGDQLTTDDVVASIRASRRDR